MEIPEPSKVIMRPQSLFNLFFYFEKQKKKRIVRANKFCIVGEQMKTTSKKRCEFGSHFPQQPPQGNKNKRVKIIHKYFKYRLCIQALGGYTYQTATAIDTRQQQYTDKAKKPITKRLPQQ